MKKKVSKENFLTYLFEKSEQEIPSAQIREVLRQVGYTVGEITCEPWERKGLLDRLCRQ